MVELKILAFGMAALRALASERHDANRSALTVAAQHVVSTVAYRHRNLMRQETGASSFVVRCLSARFRSPEEGTVDFATQI